MISFVLTRCSLFPNPHVFARYETNKFLFFANLNKISILKTTNRRSKMLYMNNQSESAIEIWEIDFFSRPVVNSDGKKVWELIVVDSNQTFEHTETVPNNLVNSKELKKRIKKLIDSKSKKPNIIKFFRGQMFNMISLALSDLDIIVKPSRRTFALYKEIKNREDNIYPNMEGYRPFMRDNQIKEKLKISPEKMPDTLKGETYVFASIEKENAIEILNKFMGQKCFQGIPFEFLSIEKIPGLIIYSKRAKSLANWLDSIELCNVFCDIETRNILIECGLDIQYLFAKLSDSQYKEATIFEKSKIYTKGVHFISVQQISNTNENLGFWLLNSQL
nr:RNA-binding protein [Cryptomonas curvata]